MFFSKEERSNLYKLWFNPLSIIGFILVVLSVAVIVSLLLIQVMFKIHNPYFGLITFIILPPFCFIGLILIPLGIFMQNRKLHKTGIRPQRHFTIDFNKPKHQKVFVLFAIATFFVIIIVSSLSYQAFHHSESVEFCSSCHSVMDPEAITHKLSPHARVSCVDCHVGAGAGWYVKSKLSGLYQVYSVFFDKYSRPIETPIHNLRPARDTCETCHWPKFFIEDKVFTENYFLPDEENTAGSISLLMKIGGKPEFSKPSGIHWHITNTVSYIARDEAKQDIPWVQVKDETGKLIVYESKENPLTEEERSIAQVSEMDCIDCHNRPSHVFKSPEYIMNHLLYAGSVNPEIPNIRSIGSKALIGDYKSSAEADKKMEEFILNEYKDNEDMTPELKSDLDKAIKAIQARYHENFFPEMKTRWDVHFSNIGHKTNLGCFRCHDDNHKTEEGKVIRRDCNHCHLIVAQGEQGSEAMFDPRGLEFEHPEDIGEEWMETNCSECHSGE